MAERQRLRAVMELMQSRLKGGARVDRQHFFHMCLVLSKVMDCAVAANQSPHCVHDLVQLLKHVCSQKDDADVRPAIVALMLSFKGAVHAGWFSNVDYVDLVCIVNGLLEVYERLGSGGVNSPTDFASVESLTGDVLTRLYPWLKVDSVLLCFDVEAGYRTLVSEFCLQKPMTVKLIIIRKDLNEQPSCLVHPTLVNFLVNGYGVDKRTTVQADSGPQPPADCTRYCRPGNNVLQVVGEFAASYAIVVAHTTTVNLQRTLSDLPETQQLPDSQTDEDLMEGPSKVSLCCPLSRQRLSTPVKGLKCKHLQCFDYENYMEVNMKRPSWRCPYCSAVVTLDQLRLDKKMAKILSEVDVDVMDVMLTSDGSWELIGQKCTGSRTKKNAGVVVDLTETDDEDDDGVVPPSSRQPDAAPAQAASLFPTSSTISEDTKPDVSSIWRSLSAAAPAFTPARSFPGNVVLPAANGQQNAGTRPRSSQQDNERVYRQIAAAQAQHRPVVQQNPQTQEQRQSQGEQNHRAQAQQQQQQTQRAHRTQAQQQQQQAQHAHRAHPQQQQQQQQQAQHVHRAQPHQQQQQQQQQQAQLWQTHGFSCHPQHQPQAVYAQQAQFSHLAPPAQQPQQFQQQQPQQFQAEQPQQQHFQPQFQLHSAPTPQHSQQLQSAVFALQQPINLSRGYDPRLWQRTVTSSPPVGVAPSAAPRPQQHPL